MMRKWLAVMCAAAVTTGMLAGCGGTTSPKEGAPAGDSQAVQTEGSKDAEIVLTLGHVVQDDTPIDLGAKEFARLVSEKSQGRIKVEVYSNSSLGDNRVMLEALQLGSQDMVMPALAAVGGFSDETMIFDLPFLFESTEGAEKVLDSEFGRSILDNLEESGFIGLEWWTQGWRVLTTSDKEVRTVKDMNGLKIRTMDNEVHIAAFNQMGASAVPMAFSEVFTSLQQGILDGQENPYSNIKLSGFNEVQKYVINTNHIYDPVPVLFSKVTWEKLSQEDQDIIREAIGEAKIFEREETVRQDQAIAEEFKASGKTSVIDLTEEERNTFVEAVQPVYEKYADKIGQENIDKVLEIQQ